MAWGLEGEQLTIKRALALCYYVGFRGIRLIRAVALMTAESGRWTKAWHENVDEVTGEVKSIDRGLFQINSFWHPDLNWSGAYNPIENASFAAEMSSKGRFFKAWAAYNSGRYLLFMPGVTVVHTFGKWRDWVDNVERVYGQN